MLSDRGELPTLGTETKRFQTKRRAEGPNHMRRICDDAKVKERFTYATNNLYTKGDDPDVYIPSREYQ